jgi:hypothetical protein
VPDRTPWLGGYKARKLESYKAGRPTGWEVRRLESLNAGKLGAINCFKAFKLPSFRASQLFK